MTGVDDSCCDHERGALSRSDLAGCPYAQFVQWLSEAIESGEQEPTAMTLATTSKDGHPSARIVLLKAHDERGLVFYTNYRSRKARELGASGRGSLCFFWYGLRRQVRVEGKVEKISPEESDAYFASRPLESQIGATASPQSERVKDRRALDERVAEVRCRVADGSPLERPEWWGGFRLAPARWEFWSGREGRLHDRFVYLRSRQESSSDGSAWLLERLAP